MRKNYILSALLLLISGLWFNGNAQNFANVSDFVQITSDGDMKMVELKPIQNIVSSLEQKGYLLLSSTPITMESVSYDEEGNEENYSYPAKEDFFLHSDYGTVKIKSVENLPYMTEIELSCMGEGKNGPFIKDALSKGFVEGNPDGLMQCYNLVLDDMPSLLYFEAMEDSDYVKLYFAE